jgi:hypothetical protein
MGTIKPNENFTKQEKSIAAMASQMTTSSPLDMSHTTPPPMPMMRNMINITGDGLFDKK